jgi:carboxyl-terminal processing protease
MKPVKRMRGEPNTKITLTVARKEEDKPLLITITRQEFACKA